MVQQSYAPSVPARVVSLILGVAVSLAAAVLIPRLVIGGYFRYHVVGVLLAAFAAILLIGIAITVVRVFVLVPVFITTTPTHVSLRRGLRADETWARSETGFISFVVRQSTNGIQSGTTRTLIVQRAGERVEVPLTWYSAATFNALIADVAPQVPAAEAVPGAAVAAPAAAATSGTFTLDHTLARRSRTTAIVIMLIGVVVGVVIGALISDDGSDPEIGLFLGVTFAVPFIAIGVAFLLRERRLPRQLTVSPSTLTVDDRAFSIGQLSRIEATPASYENARGRRVTLTDTAGQRTVIGLGRASRAFPDYDRFLEALRGATAHRPGLFTLDVA